MSAPARVCERFGASLSALTTVGLGGPARRLVEARTDEQIIETAAAARRDREPLLVIGGGSNLVISDAGFDGTVLQILTRGVASSEEADGVRLRVAAGEPWDALVADCVAAGLVGVECLSGIPGLTGATPIQNVGAYGQQVSDTVLSVRSYDRAAGRVVGLSRRQCEFAYRASVFRHSSRYVVLDVDLMLERSPYGRPIRHAELARVLGVELGVRPPQSAVREAVLTVRRGKGMVLDPRDPDSRSVGSFFLNPLLPSEAFEAFERRVAQHLGPEVRAPGWPEADGRVKTSAAWLIERAGFPRGYGAGEVGISTKHPLALVNRGDATTAGLLALARELRAGVHERFGITLEPEPTLVGIEL